MMRTPSLYHWCVVPAPLEFKVSDAVPSHCVVNAPTLLITGAVGAGVTTMPGMVAVSTRTQLVVGLVAVTLNVVVPVGSAEVMISRFDPVPANTALREVAP